MLCKMIEWETTPILFMFDSEIKVLKLISKSKALIN